MVVLVLAWNDRSLNKQCWAKVAVLLVKKMCQLQGSELCISKRKCIKSRYTVISLLNFSLLYIRQVRFLVCYVQFWLPV